MESDKIGASVTSWLWKLMTSLIVMILCVMTQATLVDGLRVVHPGRHVCAKEEDAVNPKRQMESYCAPAYTKHLYMCEIGGVYQLCTTFKVVYKLAYREKRHNRVEKRVVYTCCPGWTQRHHGENSCMQPQCHPPCANGGTCTSPNKCSCPAGWGGPACETDVDECQGNHACKQSCINIPGSYKCGCEGGFDIEADGVSCGYCLTCQPEYIQVVDSYQHLAKKVMKLQRQNVLLQQNLTNVDGEYKKAVARLQEEVNAAVAMADHAPPPESPRAVVQDYPPPGNYYNRRAQTEVWDRMKSLSEQIGMLEERLEVCTCNRHRRRRPGS